MAKSNPLEGISENQIKHCLVAGCKAIPGNSGYCFSHDPDKKAEFKIAQMKGALSLKSMRVILPPQAEWRSLSIDDFRRLVSELILRLVDGSLANSDPLARICQLGNLLLQSTNASKLADDVEDMKKSIRALKRGSI